MLWVSLDLSFIQSSVKGLEEELKLLFQIQGCCHINDLDVGAIVSLKGQLHHFLIVFIAVVSSSELDASLNGSVDGSFVIFHTFSVLEVRRNYQLKISSGLFLISQISSCSSSERLSKFSSHQFMNFLKRSISFVMLYLFFILLLWIGWKERTSLK